MEGGTTIRAPKVSQAKSLDGGASEAHMPEGIDTPVQAGKSHSHREDQ